MNAPIESFLQALPRRLLEGHDRDLLAPLTLVDGPGDASSWAPRSTRGMGNRAALAQALLVANERWGHFAPTALCDRLADPRTHVVVTGQQAGLLGGPLYTLTKAMAAVRWAARIEEETGQPAVAVFWVATEDHDFAEVARCFVPGGKSPQSFQLSGDDSDRLRPVGEVRLGPEVAELFEQLHQSTGHPEALQRLSKLADCCSADRTFGDSFCTLLALILGPHCPLMLDAQSSELKKQERPFLRQLIERRMEVGAALMERENEIERRGIAHQVKPQPGWSPLFLLDGDGFRRRIGWHGEDRFVVRGDSEATRDPSTQNRTVAELLAILDDEPRRVSPGVLARPAIQDAVLGTSLFVLGPGELSYMTQASSIYPILGLEGTRLALRPQMQFVDRRRLGQIAELEERGLELATLLGPEEALEQSLASLAGGEPVSAKKKQILLLLEELEDSLVALDRQLESASRRTRDQVERALDRLTSKATQSLASADRVTRDRVSALRSLCRPEGKLQERIVTSGLVYALFGRALVDALWNDLDLDATRLQILSPAAPTASPEAGG